MENRTHVLGGVAAGVAIQYFAGDHLTVLETSMYYSSCVIGSWLPDICHPQSKIGRKVPIFSWLISSTFGHRTITHSWLMILAFTFLFMASNLPAALTYGLLIGVASHLVLDAFTDQGIQFLWPFPVRVRFPLHTSTGSLGEMITAAALLIATIYMSDQLYFGGFIHGFI